MSTQVALGLAPMVSCSISDAVGMFVAPGAPADEDNIARMAEGVLAHLLPTPGLAQDTDPILVGELSERPVVVAPVSERGHQPRKA